MGGADDSGCLWIALVVIGLAMAGLIYTAPGPEDASAHADVDAARQVQLQHEREKRYAATRKLDSLDRALADCRLERAKLEVER